MLVQLKRPFFFEDQLFMDDGSGVTLPDSVMCKVENDKGDLVDTLVPVKELLPSDAVILGDDFSPPEPEPEQAEIALSELSSDQELREKTLI